TILGYRIPLGGIWTYTNGVAPKAKVIPVKVLNNSGGGWSSAIAQGIMYVADLKVNELEDAPVVINMSLGGPMGDPVEEAAIAYALEKGVIIVASAGNSGDAGMGYPGAYDEVISVAASGWVGEWTGQRDDPLAADYFRTWWWDFDVIDPTSQDDFYITGFSSREMSGQDLDVAAPGSWVVGPYAVNQGQLSWFFLGGTSMASPHVAGIVALMLDKNPTLGALLGSEAAEAESILETSAIPFVYTDGAACRTVFAPSGTDSVVCWGPDAAGAGLATADAALAATPPTPPTP
ncbi:MAG: S8 family serine peptidase, partial [Acidimicrobiia bacterium]|nr:S8 family serine peptidase [Acidimicrobiia bacterium]